MRRGRDRTRLRPLSNITRDDRDGAWVVLVLRQGSPSRRSFPDRVWGGERRALVAAQHFRDELLLKLEPDLRVRRKPPRNVVSRTGVVGVSLERRFTPSGMLYEYYVAGWRDVEGRQRRSRFRVSHHGRREALRLARAARQAGVAETRRQMLERQQRGAELRLHVAPPKPSPVKHPLDRKGISMARRRQRPGPTGIVGVSLFQGAYVATWRESGTRVSRRFAIGRYGERRALQLAIRARKEALARIAARQVSRA